MKRTADGEPIAALSPSEDGGSYSSSSSSSNSTNGARPRLFGLAYECRFARLKGKFDPQRAKELKVPKGPLFGLLKSGQAVTLADGTVVHPHQCVDEPEVVPAVLIVDCPTLEVAEAVAVNAALADLQRAQSDAKSGHCVVVHLCPLAVSSSPTYAAWAARFPPATTHHIFAGAGHTRGQNLFQAAARNQVG